MPGAERYRFSAADETGKTHVFDAPTPRADLSPIWCDIPAGVVTLTVYALDGDGVPTCPVGCRTFFRLSPFPADLPPAARGYREASAAALDFAMTQDFLLHWLQTGTPDPDYDLNVYPSKMISAIIRAMISYAGIRPEKAEDAMKIARNAADYLIGITADSGPMAGIPPTYQLDFRPEPEKRHNAIAGERIDWCMMIYPPTVGLAYLELEEKTGDRRYLDAALGIGNYLREHVEPCGTWYLIRHIKTGEVLKQDLCNPLEVIVPFLLKLRKRTGEDAWKTLADNAAAYVENVLLPVRNFGGQFEDTCCSVHYDNLSHYPATALVRYYAENFPNDPERMALAEELMRFAEDQFIIWKRPAPWHKNGFDTSKWLTPCGLEQYTWYVPIDASTADLALTFLALYRAGRGDLYLEKARALADAVTRAQQPRGLIPTHWLNEETLGGSDFWINCHFSAARMLAVLADFGEGLPENV